MVAGVWLDYRLCGVWGFVSGPGRPHYCISCNGTPCDRRRIFRTAHSLSGSGRPPSPPTVPVAGYCGCSWRLASPSPSSLLSVIRESLVVFLPAPRWMVGIRMSYRRPFVICSAAFAFAVAVDFRASSIPAWISRLQRNRIVRPMSRNSPCPLESMVWLWFSDCVVVPAMPYLRGQHCVWSGSIRLSSNWPSFGLCRLWLICLRIGDTPA